MYGLVDCNNFFVSCERVFNPKIKDKPVVVLSNNDGCIVSRSQEAKALKIPMGSPLFKVRDIVNRYDVKVFSANFTLYGDMSTRVMNILCENIKDVEIYSIDEAFLWLDNMRMQDMTKFCADLRYKILKGTGIPVSIGIAQTKTLAKLANHIAKKNIPVKSRPQEKRSEGVFLWDLQGEEENNFMKDIEVSEVWGVGWSLKARLNQEGIYSVYQLKSANDMWIRKMFSISLLKTMSELKGVRCFEYEVPQPRKGILSSRSFGKPVESLKELKEAVATYTTWAAEKLREQKSAANCVCVALITDKNGKDEFSYRNYSYNYKVVSMPYPMWYPADLIQFAFKALEQVYRPGVKYKKASVMFMNLVSAKSAQINFFEEDQLEKKLSIMNAVDKINNSEGRELIRYAATGIRHRWKMKQEQRSDRFTSNWEEIPKVYVR